MKPVQEIQGLDPPSIFDVGLAYSSPKIMKRESIIVRASTVAEGLGALEDEGMEDNLEIQ